MERKEAIDEHSWRKKEAIDEHSWREKVRLKKFRFSAPL